MTPFQKGGASKHKLRMTYDECRFEAQGQLVMQNCEKAHLQSSARSIMFTSVDLRTVQEWHDRVYGDARKLVGDRLNFEKRDLASSAATIAGLKRGVLRGRSAEKADVMMTTPNAKRHTGSTSDSVCADDPDEAASMASSVVQKDVDVQYLIGTSKEILSDIINWLDITTIGDGSGLDQQRRRGVHDEWEVERVRLHPSPEASPRGAPTNWFAAGFSSKH